MALRWNSPTITFLTQGRQYNLRIFGLFLWTPSVLWRPRKSLNYILHACDVYSAFQTNCRCYSPTVIWWLYWFAAREIRVTDVYPIEFLLKFLSGIRRYRITWTPGYRRWISELAYCLPTYRGLFVITRQRYRMVNSANISLISTHRRNLRRYEGYRYPRFSERKGEEFAVTCCQQKRSAETKLQ